MILKKQNEAGRSMVETIGVLVIVSLIAFGSSFAIGKLIAAAQADEINKRILALATERRVHMPQIQNSSSKRTEEGPYGVQLSIENGMTGEHRDDFWISAQNIHSDALGKKIAQYHSDTLPASNSETKTLSNGSQEVKIYFKKYDSNFKVNP